MVVWKPAGSCVVAATRLTGPLCVGGAAYAVPSAWWAAVSGVWGRVLA